jgi:ribosome-associated toxin RatA of RatAB toxin-antitoxin module
MYASVALMTQTLFSIAAVPPNMVLAPAAAKTSEAETITEETIGGKSFSVSREVVHAKPEQVWQVLTDYSNAPRVFPMLKKCQVLEDHGCVKVVKHRITPSGPVGTYEYTLQIKEVPCKIMEWHRISGDFKEVDGLWKLEPIDGGHSTLVTYSSHVNGGLFFPQMMIKRQFRIDTPQVMASLRKQAERETTQIAGRPNSSPTQ